MSGKLLPEKLILNVAFKLKFVTLCRSIVNEAAAASPVQPIVNMGQGFL